MNDFPEALENALRRVEPEPPPADLVDRCLAALPVSHEGDKPARTRFSRLPGFSGLLGTVPRRRLAFVSLALAGVALWTTWPTANKLGKPQAPASAFAETMSAMGRITSWRSKSRQIGFEPGNDKQKFRYYFGYGWSESTEWFDARRGIYWDSPPRDGETIQRTLLLPNGDWYFRNADPSSGRDKVRISRMGESHWIQTRDDMLGNIRNPAHWAHNFGTRATVAPTSRAGNWKGRETIIFAFDAPPSTHYKKYDPPTKRIDIYVDPATRLIVARQEFSRWPDHPERGERLTWIQEFDYSPQNTSILFDPKRFCAGTKEIQKQVGGPGVVLDPQ